MGKQRKVRLYARHLKIYSEKEIEETKFRGDNAQLLLRVNAKLPDGEKKTLLALVDTGAQVNLFRSGIFTDWQMRPAQNPIKLITVDGTRLSGGSREISLDIEFGVEGDRKRSTWRENAWFIEGDIQVDLILGYPWLRTVQLGILPHRDAFFLS